MDAKQLFYVEANGEPLGVMTVRDALAWGFAHDHALLEFEPLTNYYGESKMKPLERIARKINRMKEDPQDWAEFVTDCLCVIVTAILAVFGLLILWKDF